MIVYVAVFLVLVLLGLSTPDRRYLPALLGVCLFLWWFMGARYVVGCDFNSYYLRYYEILPGIHLSEILSVQEPGFQLLSAILKTMGAHYMWLNVCTAGLMLIGFFFFAREHCNPLMIMALLFPVVIVQLGMSGIRQGVAVAALMLASVAYVRGHRWWAAIIILAGAQFHTSAVVFLPIAFLAGRPINVLRIAGGVLLLSPLAIFLLSDRLDVYSDRYIEQSYGAITSGGALIRYALIMIPQVFFLIYHKQVKRAFPEVYDLLKLFVIICFALVPVAVFSSIALHRINFYVMPFSILSFVYLSHAIAPRNQALLVRTLPALAYGLYQVSWFATSFHAGECYVPYRSFSFLMLGGV